jgi:uncharacterized protein YqgC (DUF456 family)
MEFGLIAGNIVLILILLAGVGLTLFGLPGNLVIVLAAAGYGYWEGFARFDSGFLLALGGIFLGGEAVEFVAGMLGAKRQNASGRAVAAAFLGGVAGAVAGSIILPVLGTLAGAVAGAFALCYAAEYGKTGDRDKAARVARGAAAGLLVGTLFKLAVAIGMVTAVIARLPWGK